jgi:NTP pyrophosphatase (non-canonical NTP hydrolase)
MNRHAPISELQTEAYEISKEKGWHDQPERTVGEYIALMHSELSEALESYRIDPEARIYMDHGKPEGIGIELADCVIRIMDFCQHYGIDLDVCIATKMAYNRTRPFRHGGKTI